MGDHTEVQYDPLASTKEASRSHQVLELHSPSLSIKKPVESIADGSQLVSGLTDSSVVQSSDKAFHSVLQKSMYPRPMR